MIRFNPFCDSFIGVPFPVRFLGFVERDLDYGSHIRTYEVFRSLSLDSFCSLRSKCHVRLSNVSSGSRWKSESDFLESLYASAWCSLSKSVYGRLGRIQFGFDTFGDYDAANIRKIPSTSSWRKILSSWSFPLYQLDSLKDSPDVAAYPIDYKHDFSTNSCLVIECASDSRSFSELDLSGSIRATIEIGFKNPKDIMIHFNQNQFKYWADVFLAKLGFGKYRCL